MLSVQPIFPHDVPEMFRIERTSNPYPWREESVHTACQQFSHLGGYLAGNLVAFVLYRSFADEAEVIHLVCDKKHQNKGFAGQIMKTLCEILTEQGIKTLFLEVREANFPARSLYEKLGFIAVGERKDYYGVGQHALIQQLSFSV